MFMEKVYINLSTNKKIYFASDFHLGAPDKVSSLIRERKIISWLDEIKNDAEAIFLVGDIFDFWHEYSRVIPKGFIRFQGKLAEVRDLDIPVYFFHGNHDMWMFDYFSSELGITIYTDPIQLFVNKHKLLVGHGDGLGPGDQTYKLLKKVFRNRLAQWLFKWIHPDLGMRLANFWSSSSRISNAKKEDGFKGEEEWLWQYCKKIEAEEHYDYYIFGHRHLALDLKVGDRSRYVNLGEWVTDSRYAVLDSKSLSLLKYEG